MKKKIKNFLERIEKFIRSKNKEINLYSREQVYQGLLVKDPYWRIYRMDHPWLDCYLPDGHELKEFLNKNRANLVEFIIIDEFTHPELFKDVSFMNGKQYAKLIYCERQKT